MFKTLLYSTRYLRLFYATCRLVQNCAERINYKTWVPAGQKLGPRPVIKLSTFTSTTQDIDGSLVRNKQNNLVFFTGFCLLGRTMKENINKLENTAGIDQLLELEQEFLALEKKIEERLTTDDNSIDDYNTKLLLLTNKLEELDLSLSLIHI